MDRGIKPWGSGWRTRLTPIDVEGSPLGPQLDTIMSCHDASHVEIKDKAKAKRASAANAAAS